jgi:hypothetical protein
MDRREPPSADIARTLQQGKTDTTGTVGANFTLGLPPTNAQLEQALDNTKLVLEREGRGKVVENLETVIDDTKELLQQKNADQKLQRYVY